MADLRPDLRHELRADVPPGIAALSAEQQAVLARAIADERRRQSDALDEAVEKGLGFLPRVLRSAVRRSLFG